MNFRRLPYLLASTLLLVSACRINHAGKGAEESTQGVTAGADRHGLELARQHCGACHEFPEPDLLTRSVWRDWILPQMGHRLGIYDGKRPDSLFETGIGGQVVQTANVFPEKPLLPLEDWNAIINYYLTHAPDGSLPEPESSPVAVGLSRFRIEAAPFWHVHPMISLLQVGPEGDRVYMGEVTRDGAILHVLGRDFERLDTLGLTSAPSSLHVDGRRLYVTVMGKMTPTDEPSGQIFRIDTRSGSTAVLIDGLQRPVHAAFGDLTGDGREDVVVAEFGFRTGRLSWFERRDSGSYRRHILRSAPGATRSVIEDMDGDGRPDVVALTAQGEEAVYIFYNEGGGRFREERILRFPPSYGSTYLDLTDFNQDGHFDLLYVNGDNADYTPLMKGYHGIRIYLNDGHNEFTEAYFYHLDGAYKAIPRDFDGDGDLDIAAISFFPDYNTDLLGSFVYLENEGTLEFRATTFQECSIGRWLVLESGDVDTDGDDDLLLGSFVGVAMNAEYVPSRLRDWWIDKGPSLLLMRNTTIDD